MQPIQFNSLNCTGCMTSVFFGSSTDQLRPLPECLFTFNIFLPMRL
nr:MAG TPA: hypothetical protein [Bacteriophage sp.]